ncbi:MAG: heterodisulfide reductase subunit B [Bacteroidetes bacterium GWC2_33_15]|nr:MAG: heterodisulfide reductase subunit B [Bacteroidetes bacterium GWA2_33_15]OFX49850.1 MAG: heterodisulfide reductase subunit B [Bacteroidetes bacterium GWC2_33_15]OFX65041.1 MAG: heterodisulfide reductase subunit B [Bacteroidetes bacterium GWB2_32_14]OFX68997.1 MAG: heterodisulfide reductase subunit B [Bacteroidetes bacterium GWD2_33_33]HAN18262.1 heterodisulfide reductase subunit B [Bacteroidales bacterium]
MKDEGKKQIWKDYQKDIADDHYYYVRSCIRQSFFPASEEFFLRLLKDDLGKDVFDDPNHTTCTGIGYHSDIVSFETIMTVVARHFSMMKESGYKNIIISCVTSFGIYTEIIETWKHFPEVLAKTRENLFKATGREFDIPENMAHASDIIYKFKDEIAQKAKYRLVNPITGKPLNIVEHIGCHYSKMFPKYGVGGAEFPEVLAGMIDAWGGKVIDYPERRHCCGFGFRQYLVQANRGYSIANSKKKFDSMEPYKPDLILANCPGCTMFMDKWQYTISEMEGKTYGENQQGIPVLTYEELAGLVMGYNPWDLGLQYHQIQSEPLLHKLGIEFSIEDKYKTRDGRQMPIPECPANINY